jgi:hypothetical protein
MALHHQLMNCRSGRRPAVRERDRLLLDTRRARGALRPRPDPDAAAWRLIRLLSRRVAVAQRTFRASPEQIAESRVHTSLPPGQQQRNALGCDIRRTAIR